MATLTSTKIKNTYDALLKASDNDAIGSSAKQITDGLGNGTPLYISTTQIGIGVTPEATFDLHVYSNAKVGGNLTITGDLTVNGTTTTVGTDTLSVKDPLIVLANNNTSADSVDIGFYGKYAPSGTTLYAGLFRDTGDGKFKIFRDLEEEPTTTVNTSGTGYTVATLVGNLEGNVTGDITGNADTATALETARTIQVSGDVAGSASFDGTADINISTTIQPNSIALGTDTTGSYVATISGTTNEIEVSGSGSETAAVIIGLPDDVTIGNDLTVTTDLDVGGLITVGTNNTILQNDKLIFKSTTGAAIGHNTAGTAIQFFTTNTTALDTLALSISGANATVSGNLSVLGTGSFTGQVTIPATPSASTDAASKGYVDSQVGANNELSEVLANGNTTGGTDIAITAGDKITNFTSTGIDDNATSTALTIDSSENVGIGETSPAEALTVVGTIRVQSASGDSDGLHISSDSNGDALINAGYSVSDLKFATADVERMRIDSSGNAIFTKSGGAYLQLKDASAVRGAINVETSDGLVFTTGSSFTERMRIDSSGNSTFTGNITTTGSTIKVDNSGSASYVVDRGNDTSGATFEYNTNGTIKWFTGLRGLSSEDFYFFNYGTGATAIQIEAANSNTTFAGIVTTENIFQVYSTGASAVIGAVGNTANDVNIYSTSAGHNGLRMHINGILPTDNTGTIIDNDADLGDPSYRFKDLYLGGNIQAAGSVGIGTTSPEKLHIFDSTQTNQSVRLGNPSATPYGEINYNSSGFEHLYITAKGTTTGYGNIVFQTGGTPDEIMRISAAGNVGIGTTSPNDKLHIVGNLFIENGSPEITFETGSSHYNWQIAAQENVNAALEFSVGSQDADASNDTFTPKMIILQSGNVGIGTTSPAYKLSVEGSTNDNWISRIYNTNTNGAGLLVRTDATSANDKIALGVYADGGYKMVVKSSGDILFGTTSQTTTHAYFSKESSDRMVLSVGSSTTSQVTIVAFKNPNGIVGSVSTDGPTTSFSSSSDYRLKENVVEMTNALDRISQLKPSRFNFIGEEKTVDGFLAHEVSDIVPEAITGTKDEVDDEGNPVYQGIDQSKLVPLLVGAIQELQKRIEILENK